jgi:hypothetical protein
VDAPVGGGAGRDEINGVVAVLHTKEGTGGDPTRDSGRDGRQLACFIRVRLDQQEVFDPQLAPEAARGNSVASTYMATLLSGRIRQPLAKVG